MKKEYCKFCDKEKIKKEELFGKKTCVFLTGDGYNPSGVLEGYGVIIPYAHRKTPFDLTK